MVLFKKKKKELTVIFFYWKTYCHIVIININSKLEICHDILKNIPSQNQPYRTLFIAPHRKVQCLK